MAARRKKTKRKTKKISFRPGALKRKKEQKAGRLGPSFMSILKALAVVCVFVAIGVGFVFLDKYVKRAVSASSKIGPVELLNPPVWINQPLLKKIYAAAVAGREDLNLDEDAARSVQNNIEREVMWLHNVKVQTTHKNILIKADYRKPLALVKSGLHKFYLDDELVVLDFVPMPNLPIVEVKGLPLVIKTPPLGEVWQREDVAAAVTILDRLDQMDKLITPDKPLLSEIDSIDASNFNGRENARLPHIVLYAKDNTEIIWGAEVGKWQRHLESTDEQKLAKLYGYYKEYGTLLNEAKYINLCDPQDNIPLPIDKY
jgi:hypothetical protein